MCGVPSRWRELLDGAVPPLWRRRHRGVDWRRIRATGFERVWRTSVLSLVVALLSRPYASCSWVPHAPVPLMPRTCRMLAGGRVGCGFCAAALAFRGHWAAMGWFGLRLGLGGGRGNAGLGGGGGRGGLTHTETRARADWGAKRRPNSTPRALRRGRGPRATGVWAVPVAHSIMSLCC